MLIKVIVLIMTNNNNNNNDNKLTYINNRNLTYFIAFQDFKIKKLKLKNRRKSIEFWVIRALNH